LQKHAGDRVLVFTADNDTAYELGRRFLLPVLTHQTRVQERKAFLDAFREGVYPVLVTSRVLNEGIDVPEANVGIVVSGTGSTREHVQRLGRILRPGRGKQAVLYELVSGGTSESYVSERRRQHRAYQRPGQMSR
jgi:superfamily II DNA or RNA helicase